jgi:transcriptional regulator with XRE-family HTH domain
MVRSMSTAPEPSALARALGRQIAAERNALSLSIDALAARSGVHQNSIGRYERAERDIPVDKLEMIAAALGLRPSQLMVRAEERAALEEAALAKANPDSGED